MLKKSLIFLLITLLATYLVFSESAQFSGVYGKSKDYDSSRLTKEEMNKIRRVTPQSGMIPLFNERPVQDREMVNQVLESIGAEPLPEPVHQNKKSDDSDVGVSPSGNLFLPIVENMSDEILELPEEYIIEPPEGTVEILLSKRIELFSRLEVLRDELEQDAQQGDVPNEQTEQEFQQYSQQLEETDSEIVTMIEEGAGTVVNEITEFVAKKTNKGDLLAIENIINAVIEFVTIQDDFENKDQLLTFFEKLKFTVHWLAEFIEENNVFKKYYILYLIINNIFTADMDNEEPAVWADEEPQTEEPSTGDAVEPAPVVEPSAPAEELASEEPVAEEPEPVDDGTVSEPGDDDSETSPEPSPSPEPEIPDEEGEPSFSGDLSTEIRYERLMENGEFIDKQTMSVQDIQDFLESRNSCLKNIYRGKYPSQIIHDVCQEYRINPKLMLATFQKEQSLISKTSASEHKLDWALGVGCYDDGTKNARFRGFEKQISAAARVYRHWYDDGIAKDVSSNGYRMKVNYNTTYQYMENEATYSLYRYTPHTRDIHLNVMGGGNLLFARVYIMYFDGFIR